MWVLIFTRATWKHTHTWGYYCILYMYVKSHSDTAWRRAFSHTLCQRLCSSLLFILLWISDCRPFLYWFSFQPFWLLTGLLPFSVSQFDVHKWPKTNTINKKEKIYIHSMTCATNNICNNTMGVFNLLEQSLSTFLLQPLQGALNEASCFSTLEDRSTFLGSKGTRQRGQRGDVTWRQGCRHSPQNLEKQTANSKGNIFTQTSRALLAPLLSV